MKKTLLLGLLLTAACSSAGAGADGGRGLLDSTETVCDDFAAHAKAGLPADQRLKVVRSIGEVIGNADQRLRDAYPPLQRTAGGTDSSYRLAADGFAAACFKTGWNG